MKTKYNVLSIYKNSNDIVTTSNSYDTYDEVLDHMRRCKEANGHSIHKAIEVSNKDASIIYYRGFAIFTFKGIKDHFIFDMTRMIPVFIGKCFFYYSAYNFIDIYREFGNKCFDLLVPKIEGTFGGNNNE